VYTLTKQLTNSSELPQL